MPGVYLHAFFHHCLNALLLWYVLRPLNLTRAIFLSSLNQVKIFPQNHSLILSRHLDRVRNHFICLQTLERISVPNMVQHFFYIWFCLESKLSIEVFLFISWPQIHNFFISGSFVNVTWGWLKTFIFLQCTVNPLSTVMSESKAVISTQRRVYAWLRWNIWIFQRAVWWIFCKICCNCFHWLCVNTILTAFYKISILSYVIPCTLRNFIVSVDINTLIGPAIKVVFQLIRHRFRFFNNTFDKSTNS